MLADVNFYFPDGSQAELGDMRLGAMGSALRQYALGHGKHSSDMMPVRKVAELGLDAIGETVLDAMELPMRTPYCNYERHFDDVTPAFAGDVLRFVRDAGIKSLAVPIRQLLFASDALSRDDDAPHDPDAALIYAFACWYASFDADFDATFFAMPRGMITSMDVASYFRLSSFIEMARVANGTKPGKTIGLFGASGLAAAMLNAPGMGLRTPLSDIAYILMDGDETPSVDYRKAERLLARHDGRFEVHGVRFEELESGIGSVPYQRHGTPDYGVDRQLALMVMGIVVQNGGYPADTLDVTPRIADVSIPHGARHGATEGAARMLKDAIMQLCMLMRNKMLSESCVATIEVRKSRDMQRAMTIATIRQRSGQADPIASVEMLECCREAMGDGEWGLSVTPDDVRALAKSHDYVMDDELIGMGTYGNSIQRLLPALAVAYCVADSPSVVTRGYRVVSASDAVAALLSMRCAVSAAVGDGERYPKITNCYSEDADCSPQQMDGADVCAALSQEIGDEARIVACIGIPSMFVPAYVGTISMRDTDDIDGDAVWHADGGFVPLISDAFARMPEDDDPFKSEGGEVPNQLMRMVSDRGNAMARHDDFTTLESNGVMHEQLSPIVTMLGMMELYACVSAEGGYGRYIRDVGHVTALVHDGMVAFDAYNEAAQDIGGTYDAGDEYDGATNPFDSTVTSGAGGKPHADGDGARDGDAKAQDGQFATERAIKQYGVDVTAIAEQDAKRGVLHGIGRGAMIDGIGMVVTSRMCNVPLIVGGHGSGRMDIAIAFASALSDGAVPRLDRGKRVFAVRDDVNDVSAATERLASALARTGDVLLVRDVMDLYGAAQGGRTSLCTVLDSGVTMMAIADAKGARYVAERDPYSMDRMVRIDMTPLSEDALSDILWQHAALDGQVRVSSSAISAIARSGVSAASLSSVASPKRDLETLDYAMSYAVARGHRTVTDADVSMSVRLMEGTDAVPDANPFADVAGQREAKRVVSDRLTASRLGLYDSCGPRNVFIFCGPSGCGKTLMASRVNRAIGVGDDSVLVLPMSEYSTKWEGTRLVGSAPGYVGYEQGGILTNFVKAHPNGVLILDEIEKAHPNIVMMFLNLFDTGVIDSAQGEHVDCHRLTVICTSNAAFDDYGTSGTIGFAQSRKPSYEESVAAVRAELVRRLGAPFVGRIPDVVVFGELGDDDMVDAMLINYRRMSAEYGKRLGTDIDGIVSEDDVRQIAASLLPHANRETGVRGMWKEVEKEVNGRIIAAVCSAGGRHV